MTDAGPSGRMVSAVGGMRLVPTADPIAEAYILLGLRLDRGIPGLVDGYFGPAALKARVDMEQPRSPGRLREDVASLRGRLADEVETADRRTWLEAQLDALEAHAAGLDGEPLPYEAHVARCMGFAPARHDPAVFAEARATIDRLLPGSAPLSERLAAWDETMEVSPERVESVVAWLVERFRTRAATLFGLPDGEHLQVSLVRDQPWSGYNWFQGGRRSRVDINMDLPIRAPNLIHTVAHETYPGHHLEHAWKEADLVDAQGHLEASILVINTPECPISEGLADFGTSFAVPADEADDLLVDLFERAGMDVARDPAQSTTTARVATELAAARRVLDGSRGDAALLRHADGRSHDEVLDFLVEVGGFAPAVAAKRLEFIEHPLWRTYVFVYAEGEVLIRRWLEAVPPDERVARFGRLLHEPITPSAILGATSRGRG